MDLPLISGDEIPHSPHIAAAVDPWLGSLAIYTSSQATGYSLNKLIHTSAVVGTTLNSLHRTEPFRWATGASFKVRISKGVMESRTQPEVLNGGNIAILRAPGHRRLGSYPVSKRKFNWIKGVRAFVSVTWAVGN